MHPLPHHYQVTAEAQTAGSVSVSASGLTPIASAPPAEFGGPGDQWSPETLLLAAVADCFVLSFRAVAAASKFEWTSLRCETAGKLDRAERTTRFTEIVNKVTLQIPAQDAESQGHRLLEKAESVCLVSNSLNVDVQLNANVEVSS